MASTKVTQEYVEALESGVGATRVTQEYIEALESSEQPHTRITQEYVEVLESLATPQTRVTQEYVEVLEAEESFGFNTYPKIGNLGCGEWTVQITKRGGGTVLLEAPVISGSCGRRQDDFSSASALFAQGDVPTACLGVLAELEPWAYELVLWRSDGADPAWVGPISDQLVFTRSTIQVAARDLFSWFEVRNLPFSRSFDDQDLTDIFVQYADDALSRDPSPNIVIDALPCGVRGDRATKSTDQVRAADQMRNLASTVLDFTTIGRTLRVRGPKGGRLIGVLLDEHISNDPSATFDGLTVASEVVVRGTSNVGASGPVIGVAGGVDPDLGLVTRTYDLGDIATVADANKAAAQILAASGITPQPLQVDLNESAPFTFDQLVPGDLLDVRCTFGGFSLEEVMMILTVSVNFGKTETVTLELTKQSDARTA